MKKRMTDWMDELPIKYLDEIDEAEEKREKTQNTVKEQRLWKKRFQSGWAAAACCAVLLAAALNWEPLMLKAKEIFLKSRIYYDDSETFFDGEMKVQDIALPKDMERIWSQVSIETKQGYQETGLRKVYGSVRELEEDLGLSVIPEELEDLAAEELWFTYYDTSRDKEAIIDMKLNVSGQEEPVYLEINMVLETKEEQDGEYGEAFADIGIVMSEISSRENERKTEDGKPYLTISSHRPHYQLIGEDTEDDSEEAVLIYHQAQKMLTPGYEHEALFFLNGMRYYLYGIETEEITEDLADAFLKTR